MVRTLKARVVNGRLIVDEPTDLPEGAEVSLAVIDEGDDLDADERAALDAAIEAGSASLQAGEGIPARDVVDELRGRR